MQAIIINIIMIYFLASACHPVLAAENEDVKFVRVSTQFIAALGEPDANSGDNAQLWGLWEVDPGPRGVRLSQYDRLLAASGVAPAKWHFNSKEWWLEEHGLIMESPAIAIPPGKYIVTGDREVTTVLTVRPADENGNQHWELADDATLFDVTHLACRSALYTPISESTSCTPESASQKDFPVIPGAAMPAVAGCNKLDYAVLFVIAKAVE